MELLFMCHLFETTLITWNAWLNQPMLNTIKTGRCPVELEQPGGEGTEKPGFTFQAAKRLYCWRAQMGFTGFLQGMLWSGVLAVFFLGNTAQSFDFWDTTWGLQMFIALFVSSRVSIVSAMPGSLFAHFGEDSPWEFSETFGAEAWQQEREVTVTHQEDRLFALGFLVLGGPQGSGGWGVLWGIQWIDQGLDWCFGSLRGLLRRPFLRSWWSTICAIRQISSRWKVNGWWCLVIKVLNLKPLNAASESHEASQGTVDLSEHKGKAQKRVFVFSKWLVVSEGGSKMLIVGPKIWVRIRNPAGYTLYFIHMLCSLDEV